MKTKLYKKFIKRVCKLLKISKKQLFNRNFAPVMMQQCVFNLTTKNIDVDFSQLIVLEHHHPLAQLWDACDGHHAWLCKYWRYSHWKPYIQTKIDLGMEEDDAIASIFQGRVK